MLYRKYMLYIIAPFIFLTSVSFGDETNIDGLLKDIEVKTDLSSKTKMENGGISYIYTRNMLDNMQAHNLKDVLKSTYPFKYKENVFGLPDSYATRVATPTMSSSLRIYIDNQEISAGLYGGSMILYGDMDIDFVDHIEVYSGNPTYEFSTEPTFVIIKMYTKNAQKDAGSKISLSGGSRGSSSVNFYNTDELDNGWSYFLYGSNTNAKREKYESLNTQLSRDKKTTHILAKLYNENNQILLDMFTMDKDAFIGYSLDATPLENTIGVDYLHLGYDGKNKNFDYVLSYERMNTQSHFKDNTSFIPQIITSLDMRSISDVYTAGLTYHYNTQYNELLVGAKYKYKHFDYRKLDINHMAYPKTGNTNQILSTFFIENQYSIKKNLILTTGANYIRVRNNHSAQKDDLYNARVGLTYTTDNFVSKTTFSHLEVSLDPFLVNSAIYLAYPNQCTPKSKQDFFMQDFKYIFGKNDFELIAGYLQVKDQLLPIADPTNPKVGLMAAYDKDIKIASALIRYKRSYNRYDNIEFSFEYGNIANLPMMSRHIQEYNTMVRTMNHYDKFDFFNEVLYSSNNIEKKDYFDYTAGIRYHPTEDLTFSLKGTNLLDKAKTTKYYRLDTTTFRPLSPLEISPIDRQITFRVEYTF